MNADTDADSQPSGLVLAGGHGRRIGRDKGLLEYAGEPAARRAWHLLSAVCGRARVSVRCDQAELDGYADLPLVIDTAAGRGPVVGLLSAWALEPRAAWLALAVDLPLVDETLLGALMRGRDPRRLATTYRHADGTLEPLCTIWEPDARRELTERVRGGRFSLRELLDDGAVTVLEPAQPERLSSVNSAEGYSAALRALG